MLQTNWRVAWITLMLISLGGAPGSFQSYAQELMEVKESSGVLTIDVIPDVAFEPSKMVVTVSVPKHEENRLLIVMWLKDESVAGVEQMDLRTEGKTSPYTLTVYNLPEGEYTVRVMVIREENGKPMAYKAEEPIIIVKKRGISA